MELQDLLAKGYFPVQLPTGFSTKQLAENLSHIQAPWGAELAKKSSVLSLGERFSVARSSYSRRITSIINPVNF